MMILLTAGSKSYFFCNSLQYEIEEKMKIWQKNEMLHPLWAHHLFAVACVNAEYSSLLVPVHTDL